MEWAVIFQFIGVVVVIFSLCFTIAVLLVLAWYGAKSVWVTMKREDIEAEIESRLFGVGERK